MTPVAITTVISIITAIIVAIVTYALTKRREHEGDWRKLKFEQYQEFVLALSEIVQGQSTPARQVRYANAVNSMSLVAPINVLRALRAFQNEISYVNKNRTDANHDQLLDILFRALRSDVQPNGSRDDNNFKFILLAPPPNEAGTSVNPLSRSH